MEQTETRASAEQGGQWLPLWRLYKEIYLNTKVHNVAQMVMWSITKRLISPY